MNPAGSRRWLPAELGFREALVVYALFFLALTHPYWIQGEVVAAHRQQREIGATESAAGDRIENRKFNDHPTVFVPELGHFLTGPRSGWLAVWTNDNELGRPLFQLSGVSPAYAPSWMLARVCSDPWRFLTITALTDCFLAGVFVLLIGRELRLTPSAGLVAACGMAGSPFMLYWLTFPMFLAVWCWSAGALFGVLRVFSKGDLRSWACLAFSVYSLGMCGYPQLVVYHGYLLAGCAVAAAIRQGRSEGATALRRSLWIAGSAVVAGGLLVVPAVLDVLHTASESARPAADQSFFAVVLPKLDDLGSILRCWVSGTLPESFGNPISTGTPFVYNGFSLAPPVLMLALIGLGLRPRRTWGWCLGGAWLLAMVSVRPLFDFAVRHMGFGLSRTDPLASLLLPGIMMAAHGVDALADSGDSSARRRRMVLGVAMAVGVCLVAPVVALAVTHPSWALRGWVIAAVILSALCVMMQAERLRPVWLAVAVGVAGAGFGYPLLLRQDPDAIATTSPLVERLRKLLPPGARYAMVPPAPGVLPPNINAGLGLASLHSYDSLSPRRYHRLIEALGGEMRTFGRWNSSIRPDYRSATFWMSNVAVIITHGRLASPDLADAGSVGKVHLYIVKDRMGTAAQVMFDAPVPPGEDMALPDPRTVARAPVVVRVDRGDFREFELRDSGPSVLVLSHLFHRDWRAVVHIGRDWTPARTVAVDGVFQGVVVPAKADRVRLRFAPWVRFAWIAHLFWLGMLAALALDARSQWHHDRTLHPV